MKPEDAARLVVFMNDDDVVGILSQLSAKDAAAMLTALPHDRAGALGRELLRSVAASDSSGEHQP
jgi:flagellar motility protein MotE (MotC chaperone)